MLLLIAIITGCIFLPYMPGEYDSFSVPLSTITQLASITSLLFVPLGIMWLIVGWKSKKCAHRLVRISIGICIVIILVAALGAFMSYSIALAVIILVTGGYMMVRLIAYDRQLKKNPVTKELMLIPVYLVIVPLSVMCFRWFLLEAAVDFSRNRVIQNSEILIDDIETYHARNGRYPASLLSIWEDYKPGIKGVRRYQYETNGKAYNLFFEQFSNHLSVREIVMYNKLDEQQITSHNQDLLLLDAPALNAQRGYFTSRQLQQTHWKYFWFD